ncbi:MAG: HAD-IC family P-type ATPase [Oscillospiraceae bacterium]|jgi:cation-transporting ATPase E|nr:HAD-IC family P-type ATPase [Oscillospiraceae bacterium]
MENIQKTIKRFKPNLKFGLTHKQVENRLEEGFANVKTNDSKRTVSQIIKNNVYTLFNFINLILAIAILWTGSYRNLLFMGVVICNAIIGIFQEIRAKMIIEHLNLIFSNNVTLIREGKVCKTEIQKVVLDDIICYSSGTQIVAESIIREGNCEVNESLLTGEPDLVLKKIGDTLLSGSYIVSGECIAQVQNVGDDNYIASIMKKSKEIKQTKSEIMSTVKKIIKFISIAIFPIGAFLFMRQLGVSDGNVKDAILATSTVLSGMIPEGLVLLTSSILAVGVIKLSKKKVLVQDLYCIETLARIDTLCLDKTGTLTEGTFEISDILFEDGFTKTDVKKTFKQLTGVLNDSNETFKTIKKMFPPELYIKKADKVIPFSSERKWSGAHFDVEGTFVMGAAEFVFSKEYSKIREKIALHSSDYRVIALAKSSNKFIEDKLPRGLQLMALLLIKDKIRSNVKRTLNFFKKQGVDIKIISGDNPITVSKIGERVGLNNAHRYVDATTFKNPKMLRDSVTNFTVFGRVTPMQKQEIIKALKIAGKTVAMVGDGVNDVLALKEADCSVAMAAGSDVTRNISHLVLMNSDFASMPKVVAEGRQAINNIQRSSSLFLAKTIYSFILAVLFLLIPAPYPLILIQTALIGSVSIGIPSFILGLETNREKIKDKGNLFANIIQKSFPCALTTVSMLLICVLIFMFNIPIQRYSFLAMTITGFVGITLVYKISQPLNILKKVMIWCVSLIFGIGVAFYPSFLKIEPLNRLNVLLLIILIPIAWIVYDFFEKFNFKEFKKN